MDGPNVIQGYVAAGKYLGVSREVITRAVKCKQLRATRSSPTPGKGVKLYFTISDLEKYRQSTANF